MKDKILSMLKEVKDSYISGQKISEELGVSRAAIWKYINKLKDEGYVIDSISKNGYKLVSSPDLLTFNEVNSYLNTKYIGNNIVHFDTIDSTNTKAKELASKGAQDGTIVISEEQTIGRGRFDRRWCSPKYKGIWMSIILRPNIDPINASTITLIGAAAVFNALQDIGIKAEIKWPNDIILNNKKICGILTEMSSELNQINYLVIGIGININISYEEFPKELQEIATSLRVEKGQCFSRQEITAAILNHFEKLYEEFIIEGNLKTTIEICKKNSFLIGKEIQLLNRGELKAAKAVDINEDGLLVIEHKNGSIEKVISGEVTLHGTGTFPVAH
jgi:BirA family transcriptional regulator, biotin operon repressor / biotin---[acetyl-CoA-carboxylase] ligase